MGVQESYEIDPMLDPRWSVLTRSHLGTSIFHSPQWLQALQQTYAYPFYVLTTSEPDMRLQNGLLFSRVSSCLTGRRLVSLPFSDHCEPLVRNVEERLHLWACLKQKAKVAGFKYVEVRWQRSLVDIPFEGQEALSLCCHKLDLGVSLAELYRSFHRDCIERKIRRAEREGLTEDVGNSPELLRKFYRLQVITRRRHQVPPQPFSWFQSLSTCMGDKLKIRVASKDGVPVAAILTLQHRQTLVYKYGASDKSYANLGGTPLLFWRAIQDAKAEGLAEFDLGRSDWENEGLIRFKDHLGAKRSTLTYWRYPASSIKSSKTGWKMAAARKVFSVLPTPILTAAGNLLYKHFA